MSLSTNCILRGGDFARTKLPITNCNMPIAKLLSSINALGWSADRLGLITIRVSVMRRHKKTLPNDGIPGEEIDTVNYDLWWKELAVPGKIVGAYYRQEKTFVELEKEYLEYLRSPEINQLLLLLIELSKLINVILMCIEDTPEKCHRRILIEECLRIDPSLKTNLG